MSAESFLKEELKKIDREVSQNKTTFSFSDFSLVELLPFSATEEVFFFESKEWLYLSGGLTLCFGTESAGQGSFNIFFGPNIQESIGIKLGPILLEAGVYQIALLGSKLLPSDLGYKIGFGVQF